MWRPSFNPKARSSGASAEPAPAQAPKKAAAAEEARAAIPAAPPPRLLLQARKCSGPLPVAISLAGKRPRDGAEAEESSGTPGKRGKRGGRKRGAIQPAQSSSSQGLLAWAAPSPSRFEVLTGCRCPLLYPPLQSGQT